MKLHLVIKSPVGLDGTVQVIGAFTSAALADAACTGAGTHTIYVVEVDRAYGVGQLLDV